MTVADRHTRGVICDQEWALTLTATQVHATLALAAATAVGPDGYAWAGVATTRLNARRPEPSADSPPGPCIAASPAAVPAGGQAAQVATQRRIH